MKYAYRISYERIFYDEHFNEHLQFVKDNIDVIDEITIKAEVSHSADFSKEFLVELAALLKRRISAYRSVGVKSVGINCMSMIGHCAEAWSVLKPIPLRHMVGASGKELRSVLCYSGEEFLDYVDFKYTLYAKCNPDFIWSDDDIRVIIHGEKECCYCDTCINSFNSVYGYKFDRESLVKELETNSIVKENWDKFREGEIVKLLKRAKEAVNKVNPNIKLGYMTCNFNAKREWIESFGAVMGRPGGGFYTDERPLDMFLKGVGVTRQIRAFPKETTDMQYELENFNYTTLNKSYRFADIETAYCSMLGCNGILYNDMHFEDRPMLVKTVRENKKKYALIEKACRNNQLNGIYVHGEEQAFRFNEAGFAIADSMENACAYVILGDDFNDFSNGQIKDILSKGLLTDGEGLRVLSERGFNEYLGGKISKINDSGMAERFSSHDFNGEFKGVFRNVFMNFFNINAKSYEFTTGDSAVVLSFAEDVLFNRGGCSFYAYENSLGGRIAVDGYLFPEYIKSESKIAQLKSVLNYLSKGEIFYNLEECVKIVPTVRTGKNTAIMLVNAGYLDSGNFDVTIKKEGKFYYITDSGKLKKAKQKVQNGCTKITIKNVKPWQYLVLTERV